MRSRNWLSWDYLVEPEPYLDSIVSDFEGETAICVFS